MPTYQSSSSSETKDIGTSLGERILKRGPGRAATVVALSGELGAGKTTLTKGIYTGLGSKSSVTSPTFIIIRRNSIGPKAKRAGFKDIFHVDPYRLSDAAALKMIAFDEILNNPKNIVIIEWPERAKGLLPKKLIHVALKHGRTEHERRIVVKGLL